MKTKQELKELVTEVIDYYIEDESRINGTKYSPKSENTVGCAISYILVNKYGFDSNNLSKLDKAAGSTGCGILHIEENTNIVEKFPKLKQMFSEIPIGVLNKLQICHDRLDIIVAKHNKQDRGYYIDILKNDVLAKIDNAYS